MGLFQSLFNDTSSSGEFKPQNIQEAYISVLYTVVKADGDMGDEEMDSLSRILIQKRIFGDTNVSDLMLKADNNLEKFGAKTMIEAGLKMVNERQRPQLFCFCADLVLADGVVTDEEEKILEYLASTAAIPEETARKIIEVSKIRAGAYL